MSVLKNQQDGSSGDPFAVAATLVSSGTLDVTGAFRLDGTAGASGQVLLSAGSGTPTWSTLGTMAAQNSTTVAITGGTITGITDLTVADGGTGASTITANSVILGNGTSALSGNLVAPSTSGNVLTSNGTTWTSAALNFNKSLSTNGYQEFPGGLIIQWGTSNAISQDGSQAITFPKAFTTSVFQIQRSENKNSAYVGGSESWLTSITTTSFVLNHRGFDTYNGSMSYYWLAIGY
jgi:hypothetical protein